MRMLCRITGVWGGATTSERIESAFGPMQSCNGRCVAGLDVGWAPVCLEKAGRGSAGAVGRPMMAQFRCTQVITRNGLDDVQVSTLDGKAGG